jgi:hypothetical protein
MATENMNGMAPFSLVAASTGLARYRAVTVNSAGKAAYPALGAPIAGVLRKGSTHSTRDDQICEIYPIGSIAKMAAGASTMAAGEFVAASSVGYAVAATGGAHRIGQIVAGSSGAAGRVLSVLLGNIGTT